MKRRGMTILMEMLHGIGDTVCALPALALLRQNYPDARIDVLVKFATCRDIVVSSHIPVDKIIVLNVYDSLLKDIQVVHRLRSVHYDYMIFNCATPVRKAKLFARLIQPAKWLGMQTEGYFLDTIKEEKHFVDLNMLALRSLCDISKADRFPRLYCEQRDCEKILSICRDDKQYHPKRKNVGVCIGNADPSYRHRLLHLGRVYTRGWGIDNITKLLMQLSMLDVNIFLIGGRQEEQLMGYILHHLRDNIGINFVGKTSIKESIALVSICDLVIGVDTGMQHVAAAVGTKTLSIFGPTNPGTHGSFSRQAYFIQADTLCQNCYGTPRYVNCGNRICLSMITADMVCAKAMDILQSGQEEEAMK